jgi:two-component system, LytTR family, sensor kinase
MIRGRSSVDHGVAPRLAIISIIGFWCFYGLLNTLRSLLLNEAAVQWHLLWLRTIVCAASMVVTLALYAGLAKIRASGLSRRIATAAILAAVAAAGYGAINARVYRAWQQCPQAAAVAHGGKAIASPTLMNGQAMGDCVSGMIELFAEHYVEGYFLMVAWAAFYLAFGYAAETGAWERQASDLRAAAQLAELRALRYQVNPHFLFNTLNSLSALVMAGRASEAERMIARMSTFFRTSLSGDPTEDVPLGDEMTLQRLYLEIEAVRFPERLRFLFDVPDDLADACVPGLILQPLVENAVRHGIALSRDVVTIRLSARRIGGLLELTVADDARALAAGTGGTGVGLRNVADRLAARYGEAAQLEAGAGAGGGFVVTLRIPELHRGC